MKEIAFIVHTPIPESTKIVQTNKIGMSPGPLSLSLSLNRCLFMLNFHSTSQTSKIFKIKLHNPIEKIELIKPQVTANSIFYGKNYLHYGGE